MDPDIEELAVLVLSELAPYGYAMVGGQALIAHGVSQRMSQDLDVYTNDPSIGSAEVKAAAQALVKFLKARGYKAKITMSEPGHPHHRIETSRAGKVIELDLNWADRSKSPVQLKVGPVDHLDDLAAKKMSALTGRSVARDYWDIFSLRCSGYERDQLISLASGYAGFSVSALRAALANAPRAVTKTELRQMGADDHKLMFVLDEFADWSRSL